ncbi:D-amino-acid transaminase [Brevibacillus massiliensis]|uniref:D-amino-acid transaminase n=1 Tax=Brevibacillus massiliensis TaxID=1118054 RepID=UPI0002E9F60D|nr:D-amino-acid transaminase [Brevibacillus massiliensis]
MDNRLAYVNNRFIQVDEPIVSLEERGLQFGDGVYEVIRIYRGTPFTLNEHLNRLAQSAASILLAMPKTTEEIGTLIREGIERAGIAEGTVYVQITRGTAPRNHAFPDGVEPNLYIIWKEGAPSLDRQRAEGVAVCTYPDERWHNCYIKSICLLPNVIAKEKAKQKGGHEAILIRENEVKEGAATNLFIVKDGVFKTPIADQSILNGITRQKVLSLLRLKQIPVVETRLTMEDIEVADEVMITSTTQEVIPVTRIDEQVVGTGKPGPHFAKLLQWFHEEVKRECSLQTKW